MHNISIYYMHNTKSSIIVQLAYIANQFWLKLGLNNIILVSTLFSLPCTNKGLIEFFAIDRYNFNGAPCHGGTNIEVGLVIALYLQLPIDVPWFI